ncbi:phosphatidylinositol 3-kinase [Gonapodya prolifera JEL478]|uniref:Phosphatidylinositol 3-kinase VPS34 n=1 Tax=Gonapodya prolifera (strain JEL478) TaxID=1344416 RepID=A0A139AT54_GONPJ|nr:phosphatidylinositol 3-kinase [Gonapodya prolifera JEL478]|eukprot:KXS19899.1 phosphatidylinositol 3-kinase [Gonapodya prolifera JEL478]
MSESKDFTFCYTSDVDLTVSVRIATLEGNLPKAGGFALLEDPYLKLSTLAEWPELFVTCELWAENCRLAEPISTSYKVFKNKLAWNEWITFPVKFRDLPITTQLVLNVYEPYTPQNYKIVGGTAFRLFGPSNTLKTGKHKLLVSTGKKADGRVESTTPGYVSGEDKEMDRIGKLMRRYERGDVQRLDWLDNLAFREIEKVNAKEVASSKNLYLYIDLPQFDFPLVYQEREYSNPVSSRLADAEIVIVADPEAFLENIYEGKHRRLVRSHRNGPMDRDLKPNARIRDELNRIVQYPPTHSLTSEEKDLVWKFRYHLTRDRRATTKFLKSVAWSDPVEARQAADLLPSWGEVSVEDALEMLGPGFENRAVRGFAVAQLRKADDEDLALYLVQLVQALKFEGLKSDTADVSESPLAEFLVARSIRNPLLGNLFHWYLMVECEDKVWGKLYAKAAYQFIGALMETSDGTHRRDTLRRQGELVGALVGISKEVRSSKEARAKKVSRLQSILSDPKNGLVSFPPLALPLDPSAQVTGIIHEHASVFRSVLSPLRISFRCTDGSEYPVIFKTGDDLRQDQLCIQMVTLMDRLLRKENLDLKLTPYRVLATGVDHGLVQFVPNLAIAAILADYGGSLLNYLREHNRDDAAEFGVSKAAMDSYIRSCAGYSVVTYLLGVGDRHLDNLLLTPDGRLFHVDYSFILGRDPKPFPPPIKLCREMVEAMGGTGHPLFGQFRSYCFVAFTIIRRSANLILNLMSLMVESKLPDIAMEPDKAVWKVQEKFRLDLTEEEAIAFFETVINDSVGALFPQVMEFAHQMAQYFRS